MQAPAYVRRRAQTDVRRPQCVPVRVQADRQVGLWMQTAFLSVRVSRRLHEMHPHPNPLGRFLVPLRVQMLVFLLDAFPPAKKECRRRKHDGHLRRCARHMRAGQRLPCHRRSDTSEAGVRTSALGVAPRESAPATFPCESIARSCPHWGFARMSLCKSSIIFKNWEPQPARWHSRSILTRRAPQVCRKKPQSFDKSAGSAGALRRKHSKTSRRLAACARVPPRECP